MKTLRSALSTLLVFASFAPALASLTGCDVYSYQSGLGGKKLSGDESDEESADEGDYETAPKRKTTEAAKSCKQGIAHTGFGATDLNAGRDVAEVGTDRRRVKPFSALGTELARTIGTAPASLAQSAAAFGDSPPRWYVEPRANAVSVYTAYSVAFSGCYDSMTATNYATAPTPETAKAECTTRLHAAWQANPTREQLQACADFATTSGQTDPRRAWAHLCATVLTSAGFTTY